MPQVRREACKAALAALILALFASAPLASAALLPEQILYYALGVAVAVLNDDALLALTYSRALCISISTLPPGALSDSPNLAARLAVLASLVLNGTRLDINKTLALKAYYYLIGYSVYPPCPPPTPPSNATRVQSNVSVTSAALPAAANQTGNQTIVVPWSPGSTYTVTGSNASSAPSATQQPAAPAATSGEQGAAATGTEASPTGGAAQQPPSGGGAAATGTSTASGYTTVQQTTGQAPVAQQPVGQGVEESQSPAPTGATWTGGAGAATPPQQPSNLLEALALLLQSTSNPLETLLPNQPTQSNTVQSGSATTVSGESGESGATQLWPWSPVGAGQAPTTTTSQTETGAWQQLTGVQQQQPQVQASTQSAQGAATISASQGTSVKPSVESIEEIARSLLDESRQAQKTPQEVVIPDELRNIVTHIAESLVNVKQGEASVSQEAPTAQPAATTQQPSGATVGETQPPTDFYELLRQLEETATTEKAKEVDLTSILEKVQEELARINPEQLQQFQRLPSITEQPLRKPVEINPLNLQAPRLNLNPAKLPSMSGSLPAASMPSVSLPAATLPSSSLPLLALAGAALAVLAVMAALRSRQISYTVQRLRLMSRLRSAVERGDVEEAVRAFAELLALIERKCRAKRPWETHREYASALQGESRREYLVAAFAYELRKFGGRRDPAAVEKIMEAARRLAARLECSEG